MERNVWRRIDPDGTIHKEDSEAWSRLASSMMEDKSVSGDIDMRRYVDDLEECRCVNGACLIYGHQ